MKEIEDVKQGSSTMEFKFKNVYGVDQKTMDTLKTMGQQQKPVRTRQCPK